MVRKQGNPPTRHKVEDSDTLFDIAQAYYGDGNRYNEIAKANNNQNSNTLKIGQELQIP